MLYPWKQCLTPLLLPAISPARKSTKLCSSWSLHFTREVQSNKFVVNSLESAWNNLKKQAVWRLRAGIREYQSIETKTGIIMKINKDYSSPNYSTRTKKIEYIIIHFTDMPFQESLETLCDPKAQVSSHYLLREDGEIFQLVDPRFIAWHAGVSSWHGLEKLNENSIGIEIANSGTEEFSKQQMVTVVELCKVLSAQYDIPKINILGHSDIAPNRKIDPGVFFEWKLLAEHNLGKWYDIEIPKTSEILFSFGNEGSKIRNMQEKLGKLGYKIEVTGKFDWQTNYVIRAFQSHYNPDIILKKGISYYRDLQSVYEWDECSQEILESLIR
ncbi:N-acetylmuramoyl-L-alanine amidase [Ranunculus cassubicifolius]